MSTMSTTVDVRPRTAPEAVSSTCELGAHCSSEEACDRRDVDDTARLVWCRVLRKQLREAAHLCYVAK